MSYTRIFIHYVWATKYRKPVLTRQIRTQLFEHIRQNALRKDIHLDRINGYTDHVHCLVSLSATQTVDSVAQLIKGEAAHWFNNQSKIQGVKLQWQKKYFAASISLSMLETVRRYIDNQETHHQKKSFAEESNEFMRRYLFSKTVENGLDVFKLNVVRTN